ASELSLAKHRVVVLLAALEPRPHHQGIGRERSEGIDRWGNGVVGRTAFRQDRRHERCYIESPLLNLPVKDIVPVVRNADGMSELVAERYFETHINARARHEPGDARIDRQRRGLVDKDA